MASTANTIESISFNKCFVDYTSTDEIEWARDATATMEPFRFDESHVSTNQSFTSEVSGDVLANDNGDSLNDATYTISQTKESMFRRSNTMRKRCKKICTSVINKILKRTTSQKVEPAMTTPVQTRILVNTTNYYNPYVMENMNTDLGSPANFNNFGDIVIWHI
jgi:hypothetical protein